MQLKTKNYFVMILVFCQFMEEIHMYRFQLSEKYLNECLLVFKIEWFMVPGSKYNALITALLGRPFPNFMQTNGENERHLEVGNCQDKKVQSVSP